MKSLRRLLRLVRSSRADADLRAELEVHRALRQDALERDGLTPEAAARASRRALGNVTLAIEDAREVWMLRVVDQTAQDVRAALRGLRKSRGFAFVTIATLALGIGANTAVFSIFSSLVLRPLPVRDPGSLALLTNGSWSYPIWQAIEARQEGRLDGALAWSTQRFDLSSAGKSDFVDGAYVSARFFDVLGVAPFRGRMLTPEDFRAIDGPVAVVSHRLWRERFAGVGEVLGRQITVQRQPFTIVGVMPADFFGLDVGRTADVMLPFSAEPRIRGDESRLTARSSAWLQIMVRLGSEPLDQVNAALRAAQPQIVEGATWRRAREPLTLAPAATGNSTLRRRFETPLVVMLVTVGLVLLVACANIASLLLARALARRRELGVRLALGSSRRRIARLLFIESAMVAILGAAIGLAFAQWSSAFLVHRLSTWQSPVSLDLSLDWRVLGFTTAVTCLSAIVAGLAPVVGLRGLTPGTVLTDAGRGIAGGHRLALRGTLVAAQMAVSLTLVVAAGLFLRTFVSLNQLPLGFAPGSLLVAELNLQGEPGVATERRARAERLRDAAATVPGVRSASLSSTRLLTGGGWSTGMVGLGDGAMMRLGQSSIWLNAVSPGWFATMGTPLRSGRDFTAEDRIGSPRVAIVNEAFVRRYLPGQAALGQRVRLGFDPFAFDPTVGDGQQARFEIVGVAADAVYTSPRDGMQPAIYIPMAQRNPTEFWDTVLLTVNAAPGRRGAAERDVASALTRVAPSLSFTFETFDQLVEATAAQERVTAMLSAFFGGVALILAAVGLYGMVAHAVRVRRTEIGLRMALGASQLAIMRLVFRRVGGMMVAGLAAGLALSWWAARFVEALLFQLRARDPWTFAAAILVLLTVGLLAAWLPATRAARLDPAAVLREG